MGNTGVEPVFYCVSCSRISRLPHRPLCHPDGVTPILYKKAVAYPAALAKGRCVTNVVVIGMQAQINHFFRRSAKKVSDFMGSPIAFALAATMILGWIIWAIPSRFNSDSQIPINTLTTIITFLMVFLIQNAQNRESRALHLKIDELIKSSKEAHNDFVHLETMEDEDIEEIAKKLDDVEENCKC